MSNSENPSVPQNVVTPKHASTVHLAITNSDFVLVFAVLKPLWEASRGLVQGLVLEEVATVSLSPIAAKQLLRQIKQAIEGFEAETGSIIPQMGEIIGTGPAAGATSKE